MQSLKIFNTLSRSKQVFIPLIAGEVRMYVCGMTVYDYCHIGHARVMIVFDMVQRWLRTHGYKLTYVRNITDIDDKIIQKAIQNKQTIKEVTSKFIEAMQKDAAALGVQAPDHEPLATQYITQMQSMIEILMSKNLAYQASCGDINYAVHNFLEYGQLSKKSLAQILLDETTANNIHSHASIQSTKNHPCDFALWKASKPGDPPDAIWTSKWGPGRPGWHIECSAMSCSLLGEHFDLHGGGADLQFPHHENEIAQSVGSNGKPFVNTWMHNGFVSIDENKMSKSLNNFVTISEILDLYDSEVIRFFMLRAHYRSELKYSKSYLENETRASLIRLYNALQAANINQDAVSADNKEPIKWDQPYAKEFCEALDDDFNTPKAIATLFKIANQIHLTETSAGQRSFFGTQLRSLAGILGLLQKNVTCFLQNGGRNNKGIHNSLSNSILDADFIAKKITERNLAKNIKNFAAADKIRSELFDRKILLEDMPNGHTNWRRI